jgi:hypothetical protein
VRVPQPVEVLRAGQLDAVVDADVPFVDANGSPLPNYKGGKMVLNDGSQGAPVLPETASDGSSIAYWEWDLSPKIRAYLATADV